MKKCLATILLVIMTTLYITTALADGNTTNYAFGFTAPCVNETALSHASEDQAHSKEGACTIIEVRHAVIGSGSSYGYTNRLYAYLVDYGMYVGAKWHAPDMIYHSCTSENNLFPGDRVVPGGRGNTKYGDKGLSTIRIEGQFRPH